jgi:trans-2,3-dihydro-3-hydroxyanthranilate isomerase
MSFRQLSYQVVDAFTHEPFAGNAAAVVFQADALHDDQMQALAGEFNLSETTFVLPPAGGRAAVRFRWFTPTAEVDLCGHATIAGVHALIESNNWPKETPAARRQAPTSAEPLEIETKSGILRAAVEPLPEGAPIIWLDLPDPKLEPVTIIRSELAPALGLPEEAFIAPRNLVRTGDGDAICQVRDFMILNEAAPDFAELAKLCRRHRLRGFCLTTANTLSSGIDVQSRFFAPLLGVDEDPVTGSVHGPLGAYWVGQELVPPGQEEAVLTCVQTKPGHRSGLVRVHIGRAEDETYRVKIGGQAVTTMRGRVVLG